MKRKPELRWKSWNEVLQNMKPKSSKQIQIETFPAYNSTLKGKIIHIWKCHRNTQHTTYIYQICFLRTVHLLFSLHVCMWCMTPSFRNFRSGCHFSTVTKILNNKVHTCSNTFQPNWKENMYSWMLTIEYRIKTADSKRYHYFCLTWSEIQWQRLQSPSVIWVCEFVMLNPQICEKIFSMPISGFVSVWCCFLYRYYCYYYYARAHSTQCTVCK